MQIVSAASSCSCVSFESNAQEIEPGKLAELNFLLITKKLPQHFSKKILIRTNDPTNTFVQIIVKGVALKLVTTVPSRIDLWNGMGSKDIPITVRNNFSKLKGLPDEDFVINAWRSSLPFLTVKKVSRYDFRLSFSNSIPAGELYGEIVFEGKINGEYWTISIPVGGLLSSTFQVHPRIVRLEPGVDHPLLLTDYSTNQTGFNIRFIGGDPTALELNEKLNGQYSLFLNSEYQSKRQDNYITTLFFMNSRTNVMELSVPVFMTSAQAIDEQN